LIKKKAKPNPFKFVGSYGWAMVQLKAGKRVRREKWPALVLGPADVFGPIPEDKKARDWEIVAEVPPTAVVIKVQPTLVEPVDENVLEAEAIENGQSADPPWIIVAAVAIGLAVIAFLYAYH
jgi:hypothetical protein